MPPSSLAGPSSCELWDGYGKVVKAVASCRAYYDDRCSRSSLSVGDGTGIAVVGAGLVSLTELSACLYSLHCSDECCSAVNNGQETNKKKKFSRQDQE